jgi:hypothetical protein
MRVVPLLVRQCFQIRTGKTTPHRNCGVACAQVRVVPPQYANIKNPFPPSPCIRIPPKTAPNRTGRAEKRVSGIRRQNVPKTSGAARV